MKLRAGATGQQTEMLLGRHSDLTPLRQEATLLPSPDRRHEDTPRASEW